MLGAVLGKVWGTTQKLFESDTVEVHRVTINGGWRCSSHVHAIKYNQFYVERGRLRVVTHKDGLVDSTILTAGMYTVVAPGDRHHFEALEDTVALEVYYTRLMPDDIQRHDQGCRIGEGDQPGD